MERRAEAAAADGGPSPRRFGQRAEAAVADGGSHGRGQDSNQRRPWRATASAGVGTAAAVGGGGRFATVGPPVTTTPAAGGPATPLPLPLSQPPSPLTAAPTPQSSTGHPKGNKDKNFVTRMCPPYYETKSIYRRTFYMEVLNDFMMEVKHAPDVLV